MTTLKDEVVQGQTIKKQKSKQTSTKTLVEHHGLDLFRCVRTPKGMDSCQGSAVNWRRKRGREERVNEVEVSSHTGKKPEAKLRQQAKVTVGFQGKKKTQE